MAHNATNIPAKSVKQILERECVLTVNYMSRCLQGNRWFSPPASMTSRLASVTFKMANKVFIEKTNIIKISNLSRQYCSDFLDLEILRALSVIEKQTLVLFWNETSSGVMNFKISFYRLANFTGNRSDRPTDRSHFLRPVHSKMKEC